MGVAEAPLRSTKYGLVADVDGWFVVNARDSRWRDYGPLGAVCDFEGKRPFEQLGINVNILLPGQPMAMYHRENHQEDFLVVSGECLLIVEGEERPLRAWDFFHCPGGTAHVLLGAGDGPAVVIAVGARGGRKGTSTSSTRRRWRMAPASRPRRRSPRRPMRASPRRPAPSTARAGCPKVCTWRASSSCAIRSRDCGGTSTATSGTWRRPPGRRGSASCRPPASSSSSASGRS